MNIGSSIKKIRKARSLSQGDLSDLSGISRTGLSKIENGDAVPTQKNLKKISDALKVTPQLVYILAIDRDDVPDNKKVLFDALLPSFQNLAEQIL